MKSVLEAVADRRQYAHAITIPLPRSGIVLCMATALRAPAGKGYQASKDELLDRLARIKGQVGGIERMVGEDRYCIDILTQISAIQAALDKVALGLLDGHARTCVVGAEAELQDERTAELMAAVGRLMRRG
jgi:DNA-binding FrmR family transcriptional regulator